MDRSGNRDRGFPIAHRCLTNVGFSKHSPTTARASVDGYGCSDQCTIVWMATDNQGKNLNA
ncbi:MAG: hypothetical protein D6690_17150 [Nitrospirae bacterium]|nr:MAG: hypothetical protein D6690_17150 [Nitrospirota bacterium]